MGPQPGIPLPPRPSVPIISSNKRETVTVAATSMRATQHKIDNGGGKKRKTPGADEDDTDAADVEEAVTASTPVDPSTVRRFQVLKLVLQYTPVYVLPSQLPQPPILEINPPSNGKAKGSPEYGISIHKQVSQAYHDLTEAFRELSTSSKDGHGLLMEDVMRDFKLVGRNGRNRLQYLMGYPPACDLSTGDSNSNPHYKRGLSHLLPHQIRQCQAMRRAATPTSSQDARSPKQAKLEGQEMVQPDSFNEYIPICLPVGGKRNQGTICYPEVNKHLRDAVRTLRIRETLPKDKQTTSLTTEIFACLPYFPNLIHLDITQCNSKKFAETFKDPTSNPGFHLVNLTKVTISPQLYFQQPVHKFLAAQEQLNTIHLAEVAEHFVWGPVKVKKDNKSSQNKLRARMHCETHGDRRDVSGEYNFALSQIEHVKVTVMEKFAERAYGVVADLFSEGCESLEMVLLIDKKDQPTQILDPRIRGYRPPQELEMPSAIRHGYERGTPIQTTTPDRENANFPKSTVKHLRALNKLKELHITVRQTSPDFYKAPLRLKSCVTTGGLKRFLTYLLTEQIDGTDNPPQDWTVGSPTLKRFGFTYESEYVRDDDKYGHLSARNVQWINDKFEIVTEDDSSLHVSHGSQETSHSPKKPSGHVETSDSGEKAMGNTDFYNLPPAPTCVKPETILLPNTPKPNIGDSVPNATPSISWGEQLDKDYRKGLRFHVTKTGTAYDGYRKCVYDKISVPLRWQAIRDCKLPKNDWKTIVPRWEEEDMVFSDDDLAEPEPEKATPDTFANSRIGNISSSTNPNPPQPVVGNAVDGRRRRNRCHDGFGCDEEGKLVKQWDLVQANNPPTIQRFA